MKTAVITGATGFIGFTLLKELLKNNVYVYVLCRPNSKHRFRLSGLTGITIIEENLEYIEEINSIKESDIFYHLAWDGERNNFEQQYKNIGITVNCIKLAAKLKCKRFICTGSQAEYGNKMELITESALLMPDTAYGACKAAACYLTADLARKLNIEYVWVRIFSVYGPNDSPETLIMSLFDSVEKTGWAALNTNGNHIWNYLFEEDAACALYRLGESKIVSGIYNLAGKECKPLRDYVNEMMQIIEPKTVVSYGNGENLVNLYVSTEKIRKAIGEFEITTFADGVNKIHQSIIKRKL